MTFAQLVLECFDVAFSSRQVKPQQVKRWLGTREAEVWQFANWPIKQSVELNLTVTGGVATVALPAGFSNVAQGLHIFDDYGGELAYLDPDDFFANYGAAPASPVASNRPEAWTMTVDPTASGALVFRFGPAPLASATYAVQGWNLPIKRTAAAVWAIGSMSADTDLPWWQDDYHYWLVDGAVAYGKRFEGVPTWQQHEQAFQAGLERLRHELMPAGRGTVEVWGEVC